jgi:hypothetical protein
VANPRQDKKIRPDEKGRRYSLTLRSNRIKCPIIAAGIMKKVCKLLLKDLLNVKLWSVSTIIWCIP